MLGKLARTLVLSLVTLAPLACDRKAKHEPPAVEVLPAPASGSPIAAKFVEFTGEGERGMKVLLYNAGDKTAASYFLLFRYYDASDKLLKVKPGTPFESDQGFTSMSGYDYQCKPKQNVTVEIDPVLADVPAEAVRADVVATSVQALGAEHRTIEDWWSQDNFNQWPTP